MHNNQRTSSSYLFFVSWAKRFFYGAGLVGTIFLIIGIIIWFYSKSISVYYIFCIYLPGSLAFITVTVFLYSSGYVRVAGELGLKRSMELYNRAGLGFIKSRTNKILLNYQSQPPWEGIWLLPGGYINKLKGDKDPGYTAQRRIKEIVGKDCFVSKPMIANTNGSSQYIQTMIDNGHAPTQDEVYLILKPDDSPIEETDIIQSNQLRWCSADDIKSKVIELPPHMEEIALFLLDSAQESVTMKYWTISKGYEDFYLHQTL